MSTKYIMLTPYGGSIDTDHFRCVRPLMMQGVPFLHLYGCPWVDMARASLAQSALDDTDAEVFFWLDHDMIFNPDDVEKVVTHCVESEYDVLSVPYAQRRVQGRIVGVLDRAHIDRDVVMFAPGLFRAIEVGFGFTAVKRHVFERLSETLPLVQCQAVKDQKVRPFFSHLIDDEVYHGEDTSFCKRVQALDMRVGLDVEPRIFHKGSYQYAIEDTHYAVPRYRTLLVKHDPNN